MQKPHKPVIYGEAITVATKSVLKSIHIKDKKAAVRLVCAMENAAKKKSQDVGQTRMFSDASREEIRKMFGAGR